MKSKFPRTKCPFCTTPIFQGNDITPRQVNGKAVWGHTICPPDGTSDPNVVVPKPFNRNRPWSEKQLAIFNEVVTGKGNILVNAKPGSGKTTTIVEAVKRYLDKFPKAKILFIAFGNDIVKELVGIIGQEAMVKTFHSFGKYVYTEAGNRVKIDSEGKKLEAIINNLIPLSEDNENGDNKTARAQRIVLKHLVEACKNSLVDAKNKSAVLTMADDYGIDLNGSADLMLNLLPLAIRACLENSAVMDFGDMPWFPIVFNSPMPKFDLVMVDESQDSNPANIEMMVRLAKSGSRIIAVGDPDQSLFGFRGADPEAIEKLVVNLKAKILPLSVSYRCPTKHVDYLKQWVPDIEAAPNAKEGVLEIIPHEVVISKVQDGNLLVCRTNAPLVKIALNLIRNGRKAMIRGRDLAANLVSIIRRFESKDIEGYFNDVQSYFDKQYSILNKRHAKPAAFDKLDDTVEVLKAFGDQADDVADVIAKIEKVFSDEFYGVICSSIHKAKGLEYSTVFVIEYDKPPYPKMKEKEMKQEQNCKYVASSRSNDILYLVKMPLEKKSE